MKPNLLLIIFILALVLLLPNSNASAHRPIWGDEKVTVIDNLITSYAFYRDLPADTVQTYTFMGRQGQSLHAGINIPAVKGLENYAVTMALFGPGLSEADHEQLPPEHPEDLGVMIAQSTIGDDFFEPVTQTNYWGRQNLDTTLPADGTYYLLVWQPENIAGKYVLDTGYTEDFGITSIFLLPIWWIRVHLFFGHGAYLLAGSAIIIGLFFFGKLRKTK
jgi:hypothetical protein